MINFIIYEDEIKFRDLIYSVINNYFNDSKIEFEITEIASYNEKTSKMISNIKDNVIYILDIEVPGKSGLDLAREIRANGDYKSPIIIVTSHDNLKDYDMLSEILTLAFISKFYNLEKLLEQKIKKAYEIITNDNSINFTKNKKSYQIPIRNILYIEKSYKETGSIIVTDDKHYKTNLSISKIETLIKNDPRFFKVNRSCLINLNKVKIYDKDQEIIEFNDKEYIDIISKDKKRELRKKLANKL